MTNETLALAQNIVQLLGSIVMVVGGPLLALWLRKQAAETRKIHILVNSNMGIQKWANVLLTRQLAELTNKPEDIEAAAKAKKAYEDHQQQQNKVDSSE